MKKSLKFILFFFIFTWLLAFAFGATVFMLMEGGWIAIFGGALTLGTLAALPHLDNLSDWLMD